jgi:acyl-CoA thioesterase I
MGEWEQLAAKMKMGVGAESAKDGAHATALVSRRTFQCTALVWLLGASGIAPAQTATSTPLSGAKPAAAPRYTVLVVGDSLSAEYGLRRGSGWVALLDAELARKKIPAQVVNASISGDTTSGGLARLPALLQQRRPTHVIFELGANDALRGLPLAEVQRNLRQMTRAAQAAGAKVLIIGMQVPPNYGNRYRADFAALFATVAQSEHTALLPFMLKGVADGPQPEALFQADRIHPLEAAHPTIMASVWTALEPLLR